MQRLRGSRGRLPKGGGRMSPMWYILLSAALFTIGAVGVLIRRNAIVLFMCVELMLNAANLALVTFSRINGSLDGQVIAFFVMVVAAAEVAVGLAIIMSIFRTRRSASVDDANLLKFRGGLHALRNRERDAVQRLAAHRDPAGQRGDPAAARRAGRPVGSLAGRGQRLRRVHPRAGLLLRTARPARRARLVPRRRPYPLHVPRRRQAEGHVRA